jgi:hypothetical protein
VPMAGTYSWATPYRPARDAARPDFKMSYLLNATGLAAITLFLGSAAGLAQSAGAISRLTLEQRFGRAEYQMCRIDVEFEAAAGWAKARCTLNVAPSREITAERVLRIAEIKNFTALAIDSALFAGGNLGIDSTSVDGVLETLTASKGGQTVGLVASGNPTFASGARKRLVDQLHSLLNELRERAATM